MKHCHSCGIPTRAHGLLCRHCSKQTPEAILAREQKRRENAPTSCPACVHWTAPAGCYFEFPEAGGRFYHCSAFKRQGPDG